MTTEKVNDLEMVRLGEYLVPKTFRIIPADLVYIKGGISELPVTLNIHPEFCKKLNFDIRKLQKLFAFTIMGKKLEEINGGPYYSQERGGKLKSLELNDCGDVWILNLEWFDGTKKLYTVKADEVADLLNYCRKPVLLETTGF